MNELESERCLLREQESSFLTLCSVQANGDIGEGMGYIPLGVPKPILHKMTENRDKKNEVKPAHPLQIGADDSLSPSAEPLTPANRRIDQRAVRAVPLELARVVKVINEMQSVGIIGRYAIGGAVGATFYLEPVRTVDVDIFIVLQAQANTPIVSLEPVYAYLTELGYAAEGEYVVIEGWPVQFLSAQGLVEEAIIEAKEFDLDTGVRTFVFSAEHLVAIALQTGRSKDKTRVGQFVEEGVLDYQRLDEILRRHLLIDKWTRLQQFLKE